MARTTDGVPRWRVFGERTIYDNPWVRLLQVDVQPPGGQRFWHHVVRLQTVAAAAVIQDDRVLMLLRHRFATGETGWELPGGIVGAGETAAEAAVRETEEETGWRPTGTPVLAIRFQPMPGLLGVRGVAEEAGPVEWVPLAEVPKMIAGGEILGSGSLVGLLAVLNPGVLQP